MALTPEQQRLLKGGISGSSGRGELEPRPTNANFGEFVRNTGIDLKNFFTTNEFKTPRGEKTGGQPKPAGRTFNPNDALTAAADKQAADLKALGGASKLNSLLFAEMKRQNTQNNPTPTPAATPTGGGGGGGGGGVDVSSIFSPLFKALDQQRKNANSRYNANVTGITNIYGQLIGARNDDVTTIDAAYKRLQTAAASRGEADINAMSDREASRLSNNNAVLQSMGVSETGDISGGVAAEGSQAAINAETMNQSNYSGLLDSMSAASQDMARADATSFGFRQGEDIARLQGNRDDFLEGVDNQEFGLKSQQAQAQEQARQAQQQARQQAQQAAAANAASAAATAQRAQEAALANDQRSLNAFLDTADPMSVIIARGTQANLIDERMAGRMQESYQGFLNNLSEVKLPQGQQRWDKVSASQSFRVSPFASQLSTTEKNLVEQAIREGF